MLTALDAPPAITLAQLQETADLQTRVDRKYVLRHDTAQDLVIAVADRTLVLEIDGAREFAYESVYFDTPALDSFHGAAHGRRRRFKVRTRSYIDSGLCLLELKRAGGRGETVKERFPHDPAHAHHLTDAAGVYLRAHGLPGEIAASLAPVLVTRYRRATLLADDGSRATIDSRLAFAAPDGPARSAAMPGRVIVETKSAGPPTIVDRWLWTRGSRPDRVSKFGTGLAALNPQLPANKWHRTLGQHVSPATPRA